MRKIDEQRVPRTDVPELRVFWGTEENGGDDQPPPEPTRQTEREWMRREAFWAGRNRARRVSARLVA